MKTNYLILTLLIMLPNIDCYGQISGLWHNSSYTYDLFREKKIEIKGKVKLWEMNKFNGENRILKFDKNGTIVSDNFKGTTQNFISECYLGMKLKNEFEKTYPNTTTYDSIYLFNERKQLLEINSPNNKTKNTFDKNGNILVHQETLKSKKIRYYDSPNHNPPYYEFVDETSFLIIYKYKNNSVTEIEKYSKNPFENFRITYDYNGNNQLIERRYYDENEIQYRYVKDNYLNLFPISIDSTFSINEFYNEYWGQNHPAVEKWKYNEKGNLVENTDHFKHEITNKILWNYDIKNRLINEIRYDTYRERIYSIIDFDKCGNVIKEKVIGYDGIEDKISKIKIEYY